MSEVLDLADSVSVAHFARRLKERLPRIDVLVHNAAILGTKVSLSEYSPEIFDQVLAVNVSGLHRLTYGVFPLLSDNSSVILLSSSVGRVGKPQTGAYSVSKFAVEGYMQVLAAEVSSRGIRVNSYNPLATRTAMRAAFRPDEDPLTLPGPERHGSKLVWFASDLSQGISGQALDPDSPCLRDVV